MDEQIKKAFEEKWTTHFKKKAERRPEVVGIKKYAAEFFEEGWSQGIISMLGKADETAAKMGRVHKTDTPETVAIKAKQASEIMGTIGSILKKKKNDFLPSEKMEKRKKLGLR